MGNVFEFLNSFSSFFLNFEVSTRRNVHQEMSVVASIKNLQNVMVPSNCHPAKSKIDKGKTIHDEKWISIYKIFCLVCLALLTQTSLFVRISTSIDIDPIPINHLNDNKNFRIWMELYSTLIGICVNFGINLTRNHVFNLNIYKSTVGKVVVPFINNCHFNFK